jgi:DNA (cytosine-5)-methyltransferase 1
MKEKSVGVIDLFCGAGGFSEGFSQAGFKILAGVEVNSFAAKTFQIAHPGAFVFNDSIEKLCPKKVRRHLNLARGELSCLIGGPPCQSYSLNNHQRGLKDKRSRLFRSYLSFVEELLPSFVVIENVTGILSAGGGRAVEQITEALIDLGYDISIRTLRAEEYGVPQQRRRVIIIGSRNISAIEWPKPSHGKGKKREFVKVDEAISDLPCIKNGQSGDFESFSSPPRSDFQKRMRKGARGVLNHSARRLSDLNMARISHVPIGGSWRDIPFELLPSGMRRAKRSDHTKRYGRLDPNGLASTILTKCDIHWGAYIHPRQNRALTVREAARFQTFPDRYEFFGSKTDQYIQVGNAVPPLLAFAIARSIMQHFRVSRSTGKRVVQKGHHANAP